VVVADRNIVVIHIVINNNNKIDYSVRNDEVTAQTLQQIQGKND